MNLAKTTIHGGSEAQCNLGITILFILALGQIERFYLITRLQDICSCLGMNVNDF